MQPYSKNYTSGIRLSMNRVIHAAVEDREDFLEEVMFELSVKDTQELAQSREAVEWGIPGRADSMTKAWD